MARRTRDEPRGPAGQRDLVAQRISKHVWGTAAYINELLTTLRALVGEETLSGILNEDLRAVQGSKPPHQRHRLAYVIREVSEIADRYSWWGDRLGQSDPRNTLIAEMTRFVKVLEVWQSHPLFAQMLRELRDAENFFHNMGVWNVASGVQSLGTKVELLQVSTSSGQKKPDLRMFAFEDGTSVNVELKAPQALQRPGKCLLIEDAQGHLKRAWRSASEQIDKDANGVLALYAPGICDGCVQVLVGATWELLNGGPGVGRRRRSLNGIGFLQHRERPRITIVRDQYQIYGSGFRERYVEISDCIWHFVRNSSYDGPEVFNRGSTSGAIFSIDQLLDVERRHGAGTDE